MSGAPILNSAQRTRVLIGVLVERLGGTVTITEDEINSSLSANGGTIYVEVSDGSIALDVFPRGFGDAAR